MILYKHRWILWALSLRGDLGPLDKVRLEKQRREKIELVYTVPLFADFFIFPERREDHV